MSGKSIELTILWLLSFGGSLTIVAARLGLALYGVNEDPPLDQEVYKHWSRRRNWLIVSEVSAVPAFATLGVVATEYWSLGPIASVLIAMILGALGFGFLLHAIETVVRKRLEMKEKY